MSNSRMMSGRPLLQGDNTIPGVKIHKEVKAVIPKIEETCRKEGLDYFPIIVEFVSYDQMSELASYNGFPVRYPHWRFGMQYEEMARGYEYNQYRISEMVINTNPCYIFCMDSNSLVDNVNVITHAIGHNDFFKNNIFFDNTDENMINKMANHGTRIRNYMARWGYEVVTEFIDQCLMIETLIDPAKAWSKKKIQKIKFKDDREYRFADRLRSTNNYMDEWVNHKDFIQKQNVEIKRQEAAEFLDVFEGPTKNIFGFLKENAPCKPWQQDILSMLYEESMYFAPQRATKMINEGWASYIDFHILCRRGLVSLGQKTEDAGIWHYAKNKMYVLGGKYSTNPYKTGFELLLDIEDRWNKGRFGVEWENCRSMKEKAEWNKKLGLGIEKLFDVRKHYNDVTLINEFFTPEFCRKKEFFEYRKMPNGDYEIVNDGSTPEKFASLKKKLVQRYMNGGLPDIRLMDPNHLGKGWFFMQHQWDGRTIDGSYARETITAIHRLWKNTVVLSTFNRDGDEILYVCDGPKHDRNVHLFTRKDYETTYMK